VLDPPRFGDRGWGGGGGGGVVGCFGLEGGQVVLCGTKLRASGGREAGAEGGGLLLVV